MTSYNPMARVVKRAKLNLKKDVLWDTLIHTSWICSIWHLHQPPTLSLTTACLRSLLTNAGLTSARLACGPNMPQIFSFLEFCILSLLLVKMASAWEDTEIMTSPWSSSACNGLRLKNRGRGILFQDKEYYGQGVLWRNYVILETDLFDFYMNIPG